MNKRKSICAATALMFAISAGGAFAQAPDFRNGPPSDHQSDEHGKQYPANVRGNPPPPPETRAVQPRPATQPARQYNPAPVQARPDARYRDDDRRNDNDRVVRGRDGRYGDDRGRDGRYIGDRGRDGRYVEERGRYGDDRGRGYGYGNGRGAGPDHSWYRGGRIPAEYRSRHYVVDDWRGHRLSSPPRGYQWVQSGSDYLLVAIATGIIASIVLNQ